MWVRLEEVKYKRPPLNTLLLSDLKYTPPTSIKYGVLSIHSLPEVSSLQPNLLPFLQIYPMRCFLLLDGILINKNDVIIKRISWAMLQDV